MKVKELIDKLKYYNEELNVVYSSYSEGIYFSISDINVERRSSGELVVTIEE
jgi:hypothetical protein